jgi:hypothetical protein
MAGAAVAETDFVFSLWALVVAIGAIAMWLWSRHA